MAELPVVPILTNGGVSHKFVKCNGNGEAALVQVRKVLTGRYRVVTEVISNKEPAAPTVDTQTTPHKNTETSALCPSSEKADSDQDLDETGELAVSNAACHHENAAIVGVLADSLTSANGVYFYEMGFPDVLRPPAHCNDKIINDSETSFYAYAIHCPVLHEGLDSMNAISPTQFVLLNHFTLNEEIVTHFYVRLNLPHQERVIAHLSACGVVCITTDQVKAAKIFNGLLFNFICGKSTSDTVTAENKVKGYYLLPLKDEAHLGTIANSVTVLIDWVVTLNFINWNLNMREWAFYKANPGLATTQVSLHNDSATHEKRRLRLKCGIYEEDDLIDAFVSYGPWNTRCFITGVAKGLCALSFMQGNQSGLSYKDYWHERFKVELQDVSQPLLLGYRLSRSGNFLQRPSQEALWCNAKAKRVILPPEVCILQAGLKGNLWRGAFRLPSILHGLESALLAAQLRDLIGAHFSAFKFQEALTSGAYNVYQSYERLELVGDSYLTLVGAAALYVKDSSMNKEDLASSLHTLVRNKQLFQCAEASGLASYVFNETFQIRGWLPPGVMCERLHQVDNKAQSAWLRRQRISWRTLADVVEAIVGACVMYGKPEDAVKAISWLRIPIQYPEKAACALPLKIGAERRNLILTSQIANLERQIKYKFNNRDLVIAALCYSSGDCDGDLQFSRLAFLGDCILSHHVGRHFLTAHQTLDVGTINEMKQSVINKDSLACAAVRNRLHSFITDLDTAHKESIMAYASKLEKENLSRDSFPAFGLVGVSVPRGLCDLVSAIAAAIFLDCELDSEPVWKVVRPLLEPLPEPGSFSMHPVNELTQLCRARLLSLDFQSTARSGFYEVNVVVNNKNIARAEHEEKRLARKYAAVQALRELESVEERSCC